MYSYHSNSAPVYQNDRLLLQRFAIKDNKTLPQYSHNNIKQKNDKTNKKLFHFLLLSLVLNCACASSSQVAQALGRVISTRLSGDRSSRRSKLTFFAASSLVLEPDEDLECFLPGVFDFLRLFCCADTQPCPELRKSPHWRS